VVPGVGWLAEEVVATQMKLARTSETSSADTASWFRFGAGHCRGAMAGRRGTIGKDERVQKAGAQQDEQRDVRMR
jgi:hypothetical protein